MMTDKVWEKTDGRRDRGKNRWVPASLLFFITWLLLVSCSSGGTGIIAPGGQNQSIEPAAVTGDPTAATGGTTGPDPAELTQALSAELDRLGIDPGRKVSLAPVGESNRVFDLRARLVEEGAGGADPLSIVELTWTELLTGDYNQDGFVDTADLTPLGQYFNLNVAYDDPAQHEGFAWWPTGDPSGDGALNWRLARVDGDRNGLIGLGDITTIARHWGERVSGYRIYHRGPGATEFSPVGDPLNPGEAFVVAHADFIPELNAQQPVRYTWTLELPEAGESEFYIEPYSIPNDAAGPATDPVGVYLNFPPVAQLAWEPAAEGTYSVTLSAADSYDADGTIDHYEWDLDGDGEFEIDGGTTPALDHTYGSPGSYTPGVRVTDNEGATATSRVEFFFNYDTQAHLSVDREIVELGDPVTFDPSGSWSSRGVALYSWDLDGDGEWDEVSATPELKEYTYERAGTYTPVLTVTDTAGNTDTDSVSVTVVDRLYVNLTTALDKDLVPFSTTLVAYPHLAHGDVTYDWDLDGDGTFEVTGGTESYATHTYETAGTYHPAVRVTDGAGDSDTDSITVKACLAPTAVITEPAGILWSDRSHTFLATQSSDPDGEIAETWWDLNGTGEWEVVEYKASPSRTYEPGDHTIYLKVVDDDGFESEVVSLDFTIDLRTTIVLEATETIAGDEIQVDFQIQATVDDDFTVERLWYNCGDGETVEFGTALTGNGTYTYPQGSYSYYAAVEDSSGAIISSQQYRIDPGGGWTIPDGLPLLVIRNDGGIYDANYDAMIADLGTIGLSWDEVDYYEGISDDYTCQDHSPVIWYRGGPGSDAEPQVYTTPWTTAEIDDYLAFPRGGNRLLLMSQSHGINNDAYGYPCTGWEEYFGWEILPGSIPDGDPRHPWAPGTTLEPGCAGSGSYGFLKMSPRNLATHDFAGLYTRPGTFEYSDHYWGAETYRGEGSSGTSPWHFSFAADRQICGMGCSPALQEGNGYFGEGLKLGMLTDPRFEGGLDMAVISWGCRWTAPYENTGYWPPPFSFHQGTGSLWIVGYPWAEMTVDSDEYQTITRADILQNILAWLAEDQD